MHTEDRPSIEEVRDMPFEVQDFLAILGVIRPVDVCEARKGPGVAITAAHSCFCEDCQEYLTEKGEELVQRKLTREQFDELVHGAPDIPGVGQSVPTSA